MRNPNANSFISSKYNRKITPTKPRQHRSSSKRIDESKAIELAINKCKEVSTEDNKVYFHGWAEDYKGTRTKLILRSSIFGEWKSTTLKSFLEQNVSRPNRISQEYAEEIIKEVCSEISTEDEKIIFKGFSGKFTGYSSKLILHNSKLDLEWTIPYSRFVSKKSKTPTLNDKLAEIVIKRKCKDISTDDEIISFLGFTEGKWVGYLTHLVLHNSKTDQTLKSTTYKDFMKGSFKGTKSEEYKKESRLKQEKHFKDKILEVCNKISTPDETITFLGWKDGVFKNYDTHIILHNSKFGITWDTISCSKFISTGGSKRPSISVLKELLRDKNWSKLGIGRCGYTLEDFIKNYENKFPNPLDRYDLSKAVYEKSYIKLTAICHETDPITGKEHGEFQITPDKLLLGCGCPICNTSIGERRISNYLESNNISFTPQYSIDSSLIPECPNKEYIKIDFSIEYQSRKIWIEFNGRQHYQQVEFFQATYSDFEHQQLRDQSVREYARSQGIELLEIPYVDLQRIPEILDAFLKDRKDITTKI